MKAVKKLSSQFDQEAKEIQAHLSKGTPLKNESLSEMDDKILKDRAQYLKELSGSFNVLNKTIDKCDDKIHIKEEICNYLKENGYELVVLEDCLN